MHINLPEHSIAGINESMRCSRRDDNDVTRFHLSLFVPDRDGSAAFEGECNLDVGMRMQRRALSRVSLDDVGRERRTLSFANELMRHSDKWQLLEINEAHGGSLRERPQGARGKFEFELTVREVIQRLLRLGLWIFNSENVVVFEEGDEIGHLLL